MSGAATLLTEHECEELARLRDLRFQLDKRVLTRDVVEAKLQLRAELSTFLERVLAQRPAPILTRDELEAESGVRVRACLCASWEITELGCTCSAAREHDL